jgi:hypothetical protein
MRMQLQPTTYHRTQYNLVLMLLCVLLADDNFDWATATGTWLIDIFAPWSVTVRC